MQSGDALKFMTVQHNQVADIAPQGEVEFFDCTSWLKLNTLDGNKADSDGDSQLRGVWGGVRLAIIPSPMPSF